MYHKTFTKKFRKLLKEILFDFKANIKDIAEL